MFSLPHSVCSPHISCLPFLVQNTSRCLPSSELCKGVPTLLLRHTIEAPPTDPPKMQRTCHSSGVAKAALCLYKTLMCLHQPTSVQKWRGSPINPIIIGSIIMTTVVKLFMLMCSSVCLFPWNSNMSLQRAGPEDNSDWQTPWVKVGGPSLTYKSQGFGMRITMSSFRMTSSLGGLLHAHRTQMSPSHQSTQPFLNLRGNTDLAQAVITISTA